MNLGKAIQAALNKQINLELSSAYAYLAMSADLADRHLPGFEKWMRMQAQEEMSHAMRLVEYTHDRGGHVEFAAIDKPTRKFASVRAIIERAVEHEERVSASINSLYALAVKEKDFPTQEMLDWFVKEQVEEEKTVKEILARLELVNEAPAGILYLDRQLGERAEKGDE